MNTSQEAREMTDVGSSSRRRGRNGRGVVLPMALVGLLLLVTAPAVSADTPGDSATGAGVAPSAVSGLTYEFSFSATSGPSGESADGTMSLVWRGSDGTVSEAYTAKVTCLEVSGNRASINGIVLTSTTGADHGNSDYSDQVGDQLGFNVEDNGLPGAGSDRFRFYFIDRDGGPPLCFSPSTFDLRTITSGEITVFDASADQDEDGVEDTVDNCPTTANAGQTDTDGDALGDACDPDDDNDGDMDSADNCPVDANPDQADIDNDAAGNACDPDDDNDGDLDAADNCPLIANADQRDIDDDGVGDACDPVDDRTADEQIEDLIEQLQTEPVGPGNSYMAKLQGIADSIEDGNAAGTCRRLNSFENEVRAQTGKKLTPAEAADLLRESASVKTKAGCP